MDNGYVLRCRYSRPRGAFYPKDVSTWDTFCFASLITYMQRRYVDACVQTDDPDSTLTEIDPNVLTEDRVLLEGGVNIKKRKRV